MTRFIALPSNDLLNSVNSAGTGAGKVLKRKDDIPLIDEEGEEEEDEVEAVKTELVPPLAEAESDQITSIESEKDENKEIVWKESQVVEKDEDSGMKMLDVFKSLPLCTNTSVIEE